MNSPSHIASDRNSVSAEASQSAEATLRLIAGLPAPQGLEDRVLSGLKSAPRSARVLHWPSILQPTGSWMRGAAAAAIVFVVAGGGWGIYTRVQPTQPARVLVMPPRVGPSGSFSGAGAMRTPQTINGPVLAQPAPIQPAQAKPSIKAPARAVNTPLRRRKPVAAGKVQTQPAVAVAR
jgi:hypothetical protein